MTTISDGTSTVQAIAWSEYRSTRRSNTREHELAGGGIALTIRKASPRRVSIVLLLDDETLSAECEAMHASGRTLTITEPGRATHSMQYIVTGEIRRELDPETRDLWFVTADVTEVGRA